MTEEEYYDLGADKMYVREWEIFGWGDVMYPRLHEAMGEGPSSKFELGSVRAWCIENDIAIVPHPYRRAFYLDPQDDDQRFLIRMRWA